jgi:hypothetical protein
LHRSQRIPGQKTSGLPGVNLRLAIHNKGNDGNCVLSKLKIAIPLI